MIRRYEPLITASDDPYPYYRELRDTEPVHYSESEDLWVLTRYDDVYNAFKDWRTWSSARRGNLINDMPERLGKTLGTSDPPKHTFTRRLINKAFTPQVVTSLEPKIVALARGLSKNARDKTSIEFVNDVSAVMNATMLGTMFGIPEEEFLTLRHWLDDFFQCETPAEGQESKQIIALRKLREYVDALTQERLQAPTDDLLSAMILAEDDNGERLGLDQVSITIVTFLTAGFESTNNLFTNLAYALSIFPELYHRLKNNVEDIPAFIEEGSRWDSAAQGMVRTPTKDILLHNETIPENSQVFLHIGAANRDERKFENPDVLNLERGDVHHLGMGHGIHFCVGAQLGRLMTKHIFRELLEVSDRWEVNRDTARRVTTPNFRGFSKLDLALAKP
jgi:cytochrome P450